MFAINSTDPAPIWRQIEEGVRRLIALGALQPGGSVPSVRDLAKDLRVNPNTVARAYQRLTEGGVLSVKRGEGTYVADEPPITRKAERNEAMPPVAGTSAEQVGRYSVLGEIGRGGMGVVLHGLDPELGRDLALKVILRDCADPRRLRSVSDIAHGCDDGDTSCLQVGEHGRSIPDRSTAACDGLVQRSE